MCFPKVGDAHCANPRQIFRFFGLHQLGKWTWVVMVKLRQLGQANGGKIGGAQAFEIQFHPQNIVKTEFLLEIIVMLVQVFFVGIVPILEINCRFDSSQSFWPKAESAWLPNCYCWLLEAQK